METGAFSSLLHGQGKNSSNIPHHFWDTGQLRGWRWDCLVCLPGTACFETYHTHLPFPASCLPSSYHHHTLPPSTMPHATHLLLPTSPSLDGLSALLPPSFSNWFYLLLTIPTPPTFLDLHTLSLRQEQDWVNRLDRMRGQVLGLLCSVLCFACAACHVSFLPHHCLHLLPHHTLHCHALPTAMPACLPSLTPSLCPCPLQLPCLLPFHIPLLPTLPTHPPLPIFLGLAVKNNPYAVPSPSLSWCHACQPSPILSYVCPFSAFAPCATHLLHSCVAFFFLLFLFLYSTKFMFKQVCYFTGQGHYIARLLLHGMALRGVRHFACDILFCLVVVLPFNFTMIFSYTMRDAWFTLPCCTLSVWRSIQTNFLSFHMGGTDMCVA